MKVTSQHINENSVLIQLPSMQEFYSLSLEAYTNITISKIKHHLSFEDKISQCLTNSSEMVKYDKQNSEQMARRGYFLHIVYQFLVCLHRISGNCSQTVKDRQISEWFNLNDWINKLTLSMSQLTKLTRLKNEQSVFATDIGLIFCRNLIHLLYETQIYVCQIMLRIFMYTIVNKAQQDYQQQLNKLQKKYQFYQSYARTSQNQQSDSIIQTPSVKIKLQKTERRTKKALFKQINKIINFYQCELSINRSDCTIKPEIKCLLDLLKSKLKQQVLNDMLQNTLLGSIDQSLYKTSKTINFSPFILIPVKEELQDRLLVDQKALGFHKLEEIVIANISSTGLRVQNCITNGQIQRNNSNRQKDNLEDRTPNNFNDNIKSAAKTVQSQEYLKPQLLSVYQKQQEKNKKKPDKSGYPSQKSNFHKNRVHRNGKLMTKLSHHQKLQFIGLNQRFGQNRCNLQKRVLKVKKDPHLMSQDEKNQEKYLPEQFHIAKSPYLQDRNNDSSENFMILAEQTPDQRKCRYYIQSEDQ